MTTTASDKQHEPHNNPGVNPGAWEGQAAPVSYKKPPCYLYGKYVLDTTICKQHK